MTRGELTARPLAREDLHFRQLDDGVALYDTSTDTIHTLNHTAAYIWSMCDGQTTPAQMIEQLTTDTGLSRDNVEVDVKNALENFREKKLLKDE
jgi:hypothetical protein